MTMPSGTAPPPGSRIQRASVSSASVTSSESTSRPAWPATPRRPSDFVAPPSALRPSTRLPSIVTDWVRRPATLSARRCRRAEQRGGIEQAGVERAAGPRRDEHDALQDVADARRADVLGVEHGHDHRRRRATKPATRSRTASSRASGDVGGVEMLAGRVDDDQVEAAAEQPARADAAVVAEAEGDLDPAPADRGAAGVHAGERPQHDAAGVDVGRPDARRRARRAPARPAPARARRGRRRDAGGGAADRDGERRGRHAARSPPPTTIRSSPASTVGADVARAVAARSRCAIAPRTVTVSAAVARRAPPPGRRPRPAGRRPEKWPAGAQRQRVAELGRRACRPRPIDARIGGVVGERVKDEGQRLGDRGRGELAEARRARVEREVGAGRGAQEDAQIAVAVEGDVDRLAVRGGVRRHARRRPRRRTRGARLRASVKLSAPPATRRAVAPADGVEGARVERERQPRRAGRRRHRRAIVTPGASSHAPGPPVTPSSGLSASSRATSARGLQAGGAAERGLVGEPGQRVVEEREREAARGARRRCRRRRAGRRVEGAVDNRAGGLVEVAHDLQHDARRARREPGARACARPAAGVGVGPEPQLLAGPPPGAWRRSDQRGGRPAGEHELDAAGDRRARAAERELPLAAPVASSAKRPDQATTPASAGVAEPAPVAGESARSAVRSIGPMATVTSSASRRPRRGRPAIAAQRRDERAARGSRPSRTRARSAPAVVQQVVDRVGDATAGRRRAGRGRAAPRERRAGGPGRRGTRAPGATPESSTRTSGSSVVDRVEPGLRRR